MKTLFFFLLIATLNISCKSNFHKLKSNINFDTEYVNKDCKNLIKKTVYKRWKVYKESTCYYKDTVLLEKIIKNKNCFKGLTFNQIQQIFGKPSLKFKTDIAYKVAESCQNVLNVSYYLTFYGEFDTEIVRTISLEEIDYE